MATGLPNRIQPQTVPFGITDGQGRVFVSENWWLFLYNIANQVLGTPASSAIPVSPSDLLTLTDLDALGTDIPQAYRKDLNTQLLQADPDIAPTLRDMTNAFALSTDWLLQDGPTLRDTVNALVMGTDGLLQDPTPLAQPSAAVTVGASPFSYTAPATGCVSVTAGTVSIISIIRQGVTVATGLITGLVPVSRGDTVKITYSGLPTVVFLPT